MIVPEQAALPSLPLSSSALWGLTLPWRSLKTIARNPSLVFWSALPVALTAGLYFWILSSIQASTQAFLIRTFIGWGWDPQGWAAGAMVLLANALLVLVGAVTFSFSAGVLASPFNDFLAEKAEPRAVPALTPAPELPWSGKLRLVGIDLVKTLGAGFAALLALLLSWIPVVNLVALGLTFLLIAFQYVSYPQTRRGLTLGESLRFLVRYPAASLGFGASIAFLFALPLISVLALPIAVVGGTLLYARAPGSADLPRLR